MKIENKTGIFFRAIAVGETDVKPVTDPKTNKVTYVAVTPCAAGKSFGDAVQKLDNAGDASDRRGNPVRRYKVGDIIEGEFEPRYEAGKRVVERWTFTTLSPMDGIKVAATASK